MFADLTCVPENELLQMFADARASAVDQASTASCEWISQELERREQVAERRFGIDMVPDIDDLQ